ncbi:putative AC transposase [Vitis vinifera]|uniref:Putative AC transposase n=1 Tax=Vitis vinifera TaxID=29760 RepID=A0A438GLQ8_VITVI|nr:putative AC transposase [Vitis vinifera]
MPTAGSTPIIGSTSTTDGTLVSKRRKLTSVVWNYFDKIIEDGQDYAICKHCKGKLKADSKNEIKHLHVHIDRNLREKLASAIILHEYPLSIVDHVGFRDFATSLQPLFKMVSCNTIKGDIMKIYEVEKDKMISYLEKLQSRVAITTDIWTSNQKKGYMAITIHYIDESWLLQHHIVRFVYVPPPHTKEVLSDVLMDFLLDWNMDRKVSTVTVDNCSNVFPRLKQREKYYMVVPSKEEWNMAKEICGRLKLFYNITELFLGRNYPTANTFFIKVCEIKEALYDWLICSNDVVKNDGIKHVAKV